MAYTSSSAASARATSLARWLKDPLPELKDKETQLAALALDHGIIYRIADYGGNRDAATTALILKFRDDDYRAAVKANPAIAQIPITVWRRIAPFGTSAHNYGSGFDVEPLWYPSGMSFGQALGVIANLAPQVGLVNGASFQDLRHQELPGGLTVWKAKWAAYLAGKAAVKAVASNPGVTTAVLLLGALGVLALSKLRG